MYIQVSFNFCVLLLPEPPIGVLIFELQDSTSLFGVVVFVALVRTLFRVMAITYVGLLSI